MASSGVTVTATGTGMGTMAYATPASAAAVALPAPAAAAVGAASGRPDRVNDGARRRKDWRNTLGAVTSLGAPMGLTPAPETVAAYSGGSAPPWRRRIRASICTNYEGWVNLFLS
jgi:hypothetical protein